MFMFQRVPLSLVHMPASGVRLSPVIRGVTALCDILVVEKSTSHQRERDKKECRSMPALKGHLFGVDYWYAHA